MSLVEGTAGFFGPCTTRLLPCQQKLPGTGLLHEFLERGDFSASRVSGGSEQLQENVWVFTRRSRVMSRASSFQGALYIYVLFFVNLVGYALGITGTLGLLHLAFGDVPTAAASVAEPFLFKRACASPGLCEALPLLCTGLLALSMVQARQASSR